MHVQYSNTVYIRIVHAKTGPHPSGHWIKQDPRILRPLGRSSRVGSSQLAGFRVEFSEFCAILISESLSLLVSLVYLNLVRIRLLQYLSTKEILP